MNVSEKKAKIWRKDYQGKNGEFYRYSVSVSKKNEDGKYVNAYIPIRFSKKADAPEKIENGAVCSFEGFMSVESFKDKDGNERNQPMIVVMSAQFEGDSFEQMEEDIPFN
jgi:hypothetical protein